MRIGPGLHLTQTGRAAAAPFAPTDIAGLALWLKADAGTFQSSGGSAATSDADPVGEWQDQSGNARHLTQATGSVKPTLRLAVQNGLPVIRFDGTDDFLEIPDFLTGFTAAEIFVVVKADADPAADAGTSGLWLLGTGNTHYPWTNGTIFDSFGSGAQQATDNPATTLAQFNVYNVSSASGAWTNRLNGAEIFTTGTNTVSFPSGPRLGISAASAHWFDGDVGELVLYDSVLSAGNRSSVLAYLQARWGTP